MTTEFPPGTPVRDADGCLGVVVERPLDRGGSGVYVIFDEVTVAAHMDPRYLTRVTATDLRSAVRNHQLGFSPPGMYAEMAREFAVREIRAEQARIPTAVELVDEMERARDVPDGERWGAHGDEDGDAFAEAQRDVPAGRDLTADDVREALEPWSAFIHRDYAEGVAEYLNRIARGESR